MENDKLNILFEKLQGTFDIEEPSSDHQQLFMEKLQTSKGVVSLRPKKKSWWRPLGIVASVVILCSTGIGLYNTSISDIDQQVAKILPEASKTELYFSGLIEEQIKQLEDEDTPETKKIIEDTIIQLKKLETNYIQLEQDLLNGGNSKLILSAMITNFQTRIDLLKDVLGQIETIKNLKTRNDEQITI
ncbi:hypothetical protein MNBD_BACTEROID03-1095 [hydrothermal vent metagenome]|uniref:Uncharacterized protein n=1 Tax=hydrothermal vent metagenome TaxID=652676 RepID=A0A3B0T9Y2_9ZZZZ